MALRRFDSDCFTLQLPSSPRNFQEKCLQYWPSDRSARYQCFVVDPLAEYNMPQYLLREFKVTDARDGQSRTVRQFQFTDWPEQGVPKLGGEFTDFVGQVHKTKEQFGQEGPITVHCRYLHTCIAVLLFHSKRVQSQIFGRTCENLKSNRSLSVPESDAPAYSSH